MPVIVSPSEKNPTHHASLTDKTGRTVGIITYLSGAPSPLASGRSPVDRTAMKTTSGNPKYSDFEPPYAPIVQDDWSGGRGSAEFERDVTKYADANRINTKRANRAFLGGRETYMTGVQAGDQNTPGSVKWIGLVGSARYVTCPFQASSSYTAGRLWFIVRKVGTPSGALTVRIRDDNAGAPGTVLQTSTLAVASVTDITSEWRIINITAKALTATTQYWVEVVGAANDTSQSHWQVGANNLTVSTRQSAAGSTYALASFDLYYRVTPALATLDGWFFDYKGATYFVTQPASGAPKLYLNGDRGAADANTGTLSLLIDATKSWTVGAYTGCIVLITGGTGKNEPQPWRLVTGNSASNLTVDTPWTITHDTTTEYVILNSMVWLEITGHGMTAPVSGHPLIGSKGIVYFPQGDTVAIVRMREYNNAGTWTREFAADGTNKAKLLIETGGKVWKANDDDSGVGTGDASVDSASPVAWATNLTFSGTKVICGSNLYRITSFIPYPDDQGAMAPWVMKEEIIGFVKAGVFYPLLLQEMATVRSPKNGAAAITLNSYLYFSLMNGWESYYRPTLDDIGPNLDEGLPLGRQGAIVDALGYPGKTFNLINAGSAGYSSLLAYDNNGWHEEYRAPFAQQMQAMGFQVIPGTKPDRLYITCGGDIVYLPFPSETTNPLADTAFPYTHEGSLTFSKMYAGMQDAQKFVKAIRLVTENLNAGHQEIILDYKVDGAASWTELGTVDTSPVMELDFSEQFGLAGKELEFRARFYSDDASKTPILKVAIIDTITRVPNKFAYSMPFIISDEALNLRDQPEDMSAVDRIALLDTWGSETMLYLRSVNPLLDNRLVFILPIDSRPLDASIHSGEWRYQGVLVAQDA